jgi:hypothetical protein
MVNRADFSRNYVHDQLLQQGVAFPAAKDLLPQEKAFTQARTGCVLTYAGQAVTTGRQAECFANEYLGGHLTWLPTKLGMTDYSYLDGKNYTQLGGVLFPLKAQLAAAQAAGSPDVAKLTQQVNDITEIRQKMFEGTMLRNALLTSFGFSQLGDAARTASTISFIVAGLLFVLSIAGFAHAYLTPKTKAFAPPAPAEPSPGELTHA